jgi:flagellar biosynthetic protein FliO
LRSKFIWAGGLVLLCTLATLAAQGNGPARTDTARPAGQLAIPAPGQANNLPQPGLSVSSLIFKMTVMLAFVLILIYLAVYLYKRVLAPREMRPGSGGSRAVRILGQIYLGSRKSLCLVEMADRILVIGVSQQTVNLITEITDARAIETLRQEYAGTGLHQQFSQYLKKFLSPQKESPGGHV